MVIAEIQEELQRQSIDGWLFFDHHERDPLAYRVLGLSPARHVTRRWYYLIPAKGEPRGLVHRIEAGMLSALPGDKVSYSTWGEQTSMLRTLLAGVGRVAMQYSPLCSIPYVAMVDGGTLDLVREQGVEVVSSAELIQYFEARLDANGLASHLEAGIRVDRVRAQAFELIGDRQKNQIGLNEFELKQFVLARFAEEGLITDHGPIVGVNRNTANPHYEPVAQSAAPIRPGDFVLLDMWAKLDQAEAVYYDITWTGFCGPNPHSAIEKVFQVVTAARDEAIARVEAAFESNEPLLGFQVDEAARNIIDQAGFGHAFIHRTGHSIGREVHGNGANMDNFETHDVRKLIPWSCFSIEPGVYLQEFGVRSEVNIFIDQSRPRVTGEVQRSLVRIL